MSFVHIGNGYYDENGDWQKTKYCFMDCGDQCDCGPPGGVWHINPAEVKTEEPFVWEPKPGLPG